jgi:hypothetical protein
MGQLKEAGVRYLNVGGPESYGLPVFKRKYGPIAVGVMIMLVYGVHT